MNNKEKQIEKSEKKTPMNAEEWKTVISDQCAKLGHMEDPYVPVIDTLAQILERRDLVYQEFVEQGANVIIDKTSDRGSINKAKNPLYLVWHDLNTQALAYWRELGCTPRAVIEIEKRNNEMWHELCDGIQAVEKAYLEETERYILMLKEMSSECAQNEPDIKH